MLENLILILIAGLVLAFVWLLWLRHRLSSDWREVSAQKKLLLDDFQRLRDKLPYLLEGLRQAGEPSDSWLRLKELRAAFHSPMSTDTELKEETGFEEQLQSFLSTLQTKNLMALDAKKELQELSQLIQEEKNKLSKLKSQFQEQKARFPYNLAAALFGVSN